MNVSARSRHRIAAGVVSLALALTTGCGNRLPDEDFAGTGRPGPGVAAGPVDATVDTDRAESPSPTALAAGAAAVTSPSSAVPPEKVDGNVAVRSSAAGGGGGSPPARPAAPSACIKPLSPIVLGQTGAFSGVVGSQHGGLRDGVALWVRAVNARGGVQCRPIKMYTLDDGSDPGRAAANWNDLVQHKRAVAIVGTSEPLTAATYRSAAERDRIPIVGGDGVAPEFWTSPYMFPQGGEALASYSCRSPG